MIDARYSADTPVEEIAVVSFDLDDTLWDLPPVLERAEAVLHDWMNTHTPRITTSLDQQAMVEFRQRYRVSNPQYAGCVTAMRLGGLRELMSLYDYPEVLADQAFQVFRAARSEVTLFPGALELLTALGRRYPLAAITNGNADLQAIGISHCFTRVYAADVQIKAKPDPDMFRRCLADFAIEPNRLLHIGDNPVADVLGAHRAGARSLWLNLQGAPWPADSDPPHFEAVSLAQIQRLLVPQT